jgi:hypothetical protein
MSELKDFPKVFISLERHSLEKKILTYRLASPTKKIGSNQNDKNISMGFFLISV